MTQRMELFFKKWLKELIFFWNMTHTIEPLFMNLFFNMTQRIELFCFLDLIFTVWLREFNFWRKKHIDAKNWTLLLEYDAKNWTLFECDSKNWTSFFSNMTQRIEPFFEQDSQNWFFVENMTHRIKPFFSTWLKNWTFF